MASPTVPVIDLGPFLAGDPSGKAQVARQVRDACEQVGFLIITGHGVPAQLIDSMSAVSRQFFDLPTEEKCKTLPPERQYPRGYSMLMDESLAYSADKVSPPDLKESLSIGQIDVPNDDYYHNAVAGLSFTDNIWPAQPATLRSVWSQYYRELERVAGDVMRIFALALELPERFFEDKLDRHVSVLRALNYPEPATPPLPGQLRAGEHTDFGSLTILLQEDRPGGLQVRTRTGEWSDVHPVPHSFTVNIGDLMQMWTNDGWVSTLHRVVNPPPGAERISRRQSIAFFQQPNYDALISCLDSCIGPARPPKYSPITSGEHLWSKIKRAKTVAGQTAS